jgi:hypothetical protein
MNPIEALMDEINRPSDLPPGPLHRAYERGVIGMGHGIVGAAVAGFLWPVTDWTDVAVRLCVAVIYWTVKEWGDLRRGGSLRDGLEDAACVALGLFYAGQWYAPMVCLGLGGYLMYRGAVKAL